MTKQRRCAPVQLPDEQPYCVWCRRQLHRLELLGDRRPVCPVFQPGGFALLPFPALDLGPMTATEQWLGFNFSALQTSRNRERNAAEARVMRLELLLAVGEKEEA